MNDAKSLLSKLGFSVRLLGQHWTGSTGRPRRHDPLKPSQNRHLWPDLARDDP